MKEQKFIITLEGRIRLGLVHMHKDLIQENDHCIGGGYYQVDAIGGKLMLDRRSLDYGEPRWHYIDVLCVPKDYQGLQIVYEYDNGDVFNVSDQLTILYV